MSNKLKTASNVFESAMGFVTLVGVAVVVVFLFIGYVATGGNSLGGFFWWLLDALALFSG